MALVGLFLSKAFLNFRPTLHEYNAVARHKTDTRPGLFLRNNSRGVRVSTMRLMLKEKEVDQFLLEGKGQYYQWMFRAKPKMKENERVVFTWNNFDLAEAVVWYIDPPGRAVVKGEPKSHRRMWIVHFMKFKYLAD